MNAADRQKQQLPSYFQWLDVTRGIAATLIVIFHYKHYFLTHQGGRTEDIPPLMDFPYASFLMPIYSSGWMAVNLFWVLSGFVFAHVYWQRSTTARDFFVARFARLYPLHFATLLVVAVLQMVSLQWAGHWQIYGNNDLRHFVMHIFLSDQMFTFSRGLSFNAPIWSVSAEIAAYFVFFVTLPLTRRSPFFGSLILCSVAFAIIYAQVDLLIFSPQIVSTAGYFFAGSALFAILRHRHDDIRLITCIGLLGAGLTIALARTGNTTPAIVAGCCTLIWAMAFLDRFAPEMGVRLRWVGDLSYSIYLVHGPIQIAVLTGADIFFGGTRAFAFSYWLLPLHLVVTISVAALVHYRFERPVGRWLRRKFKPNASKPA